MKLLYTILLLSALTAMAATRITATITITNVPVAGETLTVNGNTRTWVASATNTTTQIATAASIEAAATNLFAAIAKVPYSGPLILARISTNGITLTAQVGGGMVVSSTTNWMSYTLSTQTVTTLTAVRVPISGEASAAAMTNIASELVSGIGAYSSNAIPQSSTAASQLVGLTNSQYISGSKSISTLTVSNQLTIPNGSSLVIGDTGEIYLPYVTNITSYSGGHLAIATNEYPEYISTPYRIYVDKGDGSGEYYGVSYVNELTNFVSQASLPTKAVMLTNSTMTGRLAWSGSVDGADLVIPSKASTNTPYAAAGSVYYDIATGRVKWYASDWVSPMIESAPDVSGIIRMASVASTLTTNPASAAVWSDGAEVKYRTATTSEGAGSNNRMHNRGAEVIGSGSDYTLTTSYARVDFGGTDLEFNKLPSVGTYMVTADITVDDTTNADDALYFKLYNVDDAADIANSEVHVESNGHNHQQVRITSILTVDDAKRLQVYGKNATSARGTVTSVHSKLVYIRLY